MKLKVKALSGVCFFTVFFLMLLTSYAMASSGGGQKHWTVDDWIRVMNFTVLVSVLFYLLRKPVADALNGRIEAIKNQLEDLENKKQEAEKTLAEYEEKIATLADEVSKIEAQYKEQGEAAKQRILEAAKNSAEKLEVQAKRNIDNEFQQARQVLQAEIMSKALEKAEEIIKKSISDKDQDRLVDEYLEKGGGIVKDIAISRRYAKALMLIGGEDGKADEYRKELSGFAALINKETELNDTICNPLYPVAERRMVLQEILNKIKMSKLMKAFTTLLFDKGRFGFLESINEHYQLLADELKGVAHASVVSAVELSADAVKKIQASLSKLTGKDVALNVEQDPELIGGIVTKIGDLVLDGSIRTQILNMRESFKRGEIV